MNHPSRSTGACIAISVNKPATAPAATSRSVCAAKTRHAVAAGDAAVRREGHGGLRPPRPPAGHGRRGRRTRSSKKRSSRPSPTSTSISTVCSSWCSSAASRTCASCRCSTKATSNARPARAHDGVRGHQGRAGHPRHRPRHGRPGQSARADQGHRHQHLHPRRDAARPHVSGAAEVRPPRRPLRRRLAEAAGRVHAVHRPHSRDDQLRADPEGAVQGPPLHDARHGGPGRQASQDRRLL
jgi:hypothetical protein